MAKAPLKSSTSFNGLTLTVHFSGSDMDNYLLDLEEQLGFPDFRKRYVVAEEFHESKVLNNPNHIMSNLNYSNNRIYLKI